MAATETQVNNYLSAIRLELSNYGLKLSKMQQLGQTPSFAKELKFMFLQAFVEIANWYLEEWDDTTNNGFTVAEFNNIQRHINKIANSFHWLEME